jgi:AraC-like DNA-binding protein
MNPLNTDFNVCWLTDPATAGTPAILSAVPAFQRLDYPLPPEIGHGWLERLPLADGVALFRGVHRFESPVAGQWIPLMEFSHTFPEPTLIVQTVKGGPICHQEFHPPAELTYKPGHDFFRYADRFQVIPRVDASSNSEMIASEISATVLIELIGAELAELLIARLGLESHPAVKVWPMPMTVSAPLSAAFSTQFQGMLQKLFAQSKVLEHLCALVAHTVAREPRWPPLRRKRDRLQELHDYLTHLEGKLPTLDELAVQFGMSARRLNDTFTQAYGLPIYAFITDRRLNEAHTAILGGDITLKSLAMRLGYSHVNHFNTAFRKKFGYPPGQLRKGRRAEEV